MTGRHAIVFTPEQIALLGTVPDRVLAEAMGVSVFVVLANRRVRGIPPCRKWQTGRGPRVGKAKRANKPYWTPKRVALLGTDIDRKIAKKLKIPHSSVSQERLRRGIDAVGPQRVIKKSIARLERMRPILEQMNNTEAGEYYGLTRERTRQIRKKLGMPPSPRGNGERVVDHIGKQTPMGLDILDVVGDEVKLRCVCGREFQVTKLAYTQRKFCGECTVYERNGEIGKTYDRLTIKDIWKGETEVMAKCDCSCGGKWEGMITNVLSGATRSCGCLNAEYKKRVSLYGFGGKEKKATE